MSLLCAALLALGLSPGLQEPAESEVQAESLRGSLVSDLDDSPVAWARVKVVGVRILDHKMVRGNFAGEYLVPHPARCDEMASPLHDGVDYLRIEAPGHAPTLVDPCSTAPWANPARLRATATLVVAFVPPRRPRTVMVTVDAAELSWPPRSGLTFAEDESWTGSHAECSVTIRNLPAQTPLFVTLDEARLGTFLVLQPGEERELDLEALTKQPVRFRPGHRAASEYVPVLASVRPNTGPLEPTWFEVLQRGWRDPHLIDRGYEYVHRFRECNHIGALPGRSWLVAHSRSGWIGSTAIEAEVSDENVRPLVSMRPGALLRIDATGLEAASHFVVFQDGLAFVEGDLLPGVVRYEVVPAGTVKIGIAAEGRETTTREIAAAAGAILELKL